MSKRIVWISTGGTISCIHSDYGLIPDAGIEQAHKMLEYAGISSENVDFCSLMNIDSSNMSYDNVRTLGETINTYISRYDGVVITHGTDTMAYTSAILYKMFEFVLIPIILTGSQLPFFDDDSDGIVNLRNAFRLASDSNFAGVYIVFGDKVLYGNSAHKEYSINKNAFISSGSYKAEIVDDKAINIRQPEIGVFKYRPNFNDNVNAITITPATKVNVFINAIEQGCKGIIVVGYGCGGIPEKLLAGVEKAIQQGIKVMLISQCFYEGVFLGVYEVGNKALSCGVISGGNLTLEAAMAEMMFMLA